MVQGAVAAREVPGARAGYDCPNPARTRCVRIARAGIRDADAHMLRGAIPFARGSAGADTKLPGSSLRAGPAPKRCRRGIAWPLARRLSAASANRFYIA